MKTFTNLAANAAVMAIYLASQSAASEMLAQEITEGEITSAETSAVVDETNNNTTFVIFEAAEALYHAFTAPLWQTDAVYEAADALVPNDGSIFAESLNFSLMGFANSTELAIKKLYTELKNNISQQPNFHETLQALDAQYSSVRTAEMLFHYYLANYQVEQSQQYETIRIEREAARNYADAESCAAVTDQLIATYGTQATLPYIIEMYCRYNEDYKMYLQTILPELATNGEN